MATPPDFSVGQVLTAAHMDAVGLWKITPTSVSGTGASISGSDVVVSSGGTNFTVNGAFSADFANYKIVFRGFEANSPTAVYMAMGTTNTGSSHRQAGFFVNTSSGIVGSGNNGQSRWELPIIARSGLSSGCEITIIAPQLPQETTVVGTGVDGDPGSFYRSMVGMHLSDTQFTQLYFSTFSTETITNLTLSIYGFN